MADAREVFCHYAGRWVPLGRARKLCPHCGGSLDMSSHAVRDVPTETRPEVARP